jgi:AraC-like DNA-binding protein
VHDFVEAFCVVRGSGLHEAGPAAQPLEYGDIVYIPPGAAHAVSNEPHYQLQLVNVAFPAATWSQLLTLACQPALASAGVPAVHRAEGPAQADRRVEYFTRLLRCYHAGPTEEDLLHFMLELSATLRAAAPPRSVRVPWLDDVLRLLDDEDVLLGGLQEWLARCSVSYGHLAKVCQRELGVSPTVLVSRARVERAKVLLATTTDPVSAIAHRSGFATMSYFYTAFTRELGIAPGRFRKVSFSALEVGPQRSSPRE